MSKSRKNGGFSDTEKEGLRKKIREMYLQELKEILGDPQNLKQAVIDQNVLKKNIDLKKFFKNGYLQKSGDGEKQRFAQISDQPERIINLKEKYFHSTRITDWELIVFSSAYFNAGRKVNDSLMYSQFPGLTRDQVKANQLKELIEEVQLSVAKELREFKDPNFVARNMHDFGYETEEKVRSIQLKTNDGYEIDAVSKNRITELGSKGSVIIEWLNPTDAEAIRDKQKFEGQPKPVSTAAPVQDRPVQNKKFGMRAILNFFKRGASSTASQTQANASATTEKKSASAEIREQKAEQIGRPTSKDELDAKVLEPRPRKPK